VLARPGLTAAGPAGPALRAWRAGSLLVSGTGKLTRIPDLAGSGIYPPAVPDDRAVFLVFSWAHQAAPPSWSAGLSSSTISASTTSSS
jgi:hypothetical protein